MRKLSNQNAVMYDFKVGMPSNVTTENANILYKFDLKMGSNW